MRRSWALSTLWPPAPYWLGWCQYNVTSWDRSHGLPALFRVWQHVQLSDANLGTSSTMCKETKLKRLTQARRYTWAGKYPLHHDQMGIDYNCCSIWWSRSVMLHINSRDSLHVVVSFPFQPPKRQNQRGTRIWMKMKMMMQKIEIQRLMLRVPSNQSEVWGEGRSAGKLVLPLTLMMITIRIFLKQAMKVKWLTFGSGSVSLLTNKMLWVELYQCCRCAIIICSFFIHQAHSIY